MASAKCNQCNRWFNSSVSSRCPECFSFDFQEFEGPDSNISGGASGPILLATTQEITGRDIESYLGLVFGAGNAAFTFEGTSGKANTALEKAERQLSSAAFEMGANAVIGITFSMDGSGNALNRSQTITLLGTAVKLTSPEHCED